MSDRLFSEAEARRERFEQTLLEALAEEAAAQEQEADMLLAEWDPAGVPEPSAAHLEAMRAMLEGRHPAQKKARRSSPLLRLAACLMLTAGVLGLAFPTQAAALLSRMTSFVFERFETHTSITVEGQSVPASETSAALLPGWLPEGFVPGDRHAGRFSSMTSYVCGDRRITLSQMPADGTTAAVDTENAYTENTAVAGMEALYVEKEIVQTAQTCRTLVFHDDESLFILTAYDVSREDLFKTAESLKGGDAP